jgi:hypothetical protein
MVFRTTRRFGKKISFLLSGVTLSLSLSMKGHVCLATVMPKRTHVDDSGEAGAGADGNATEKKAQGQS